MLTANHDQINKQRDEDLPEATKVAGYRKYASGGTDLTTAEELKDLLAGVLTHPFADNVSDTIVGSASDRMEFKGWFVENKDVSSFAYELGVMNSLSSLSSEAHYAAIRDGNTAVVTGWDAERNMVALSHEDWWDGETGIWVHYDTQRRSVYAVKDWKVIEADGVGINQLFTYREVYFDEHIERYRRSAAVDWEVYRAPGDEDVALVDVNGVLWPAWVRRDGRPLRLPVIHFANVARSPNLYGESDLKIVPAYQDRLTDTLNFIQVAERLTAAQMYWATGVSETNEEGAETQLKAVPGSFVTSDNPEARFGYFPPGSLMELVRSYREKLSTVARNLRMPVHFFTGDWPSGEALFRAEMTLVDRVKQRMGRFGPSWVLVAHRATEISNVFGGTRLDEDALLTPVWGSPERRDPINEMAAQREQFTAAGLASDIGIAPHIYLGWVGFDQKRLADLQAHPYYKSWLNAKLEGVRLGAATARKGLENINNETPQPPEQSAPDKNQMSLREAEHPMSEKMEVSPPE